MLKATWRDINHPVFWPPFLLLVGALALSMADTTTFTSLTGAANSWVLTHFSNVFAYSALGLFVVCLVVLASPLGSYRIGGDAARPKLTLWQWFTITLCTTIAAGILFWATAEPIYHVSGPPASLGLKPGSPEAAEFAMSTLFMHWTLTPYAIYTLPALMFAFAFYNMKQPFSLAACLAPLFGGQAPKRVGRLVDAVCLYALVAGMAASLGTGILTLAGGLQHLYGVESGPVVWIGIGLAIVAAFVASASTGLTRGIRILSDLNTKVFFVIVLFIFAFGPMKFLMTLGVDSAVQYASTFIERSLFLSFTDGDTWPQSWTVFYWAVWLAWAPVTALFLGRIAYGYSVRAFIVMNLFLPALFSAIWMLVLGGTALQMDTVAGLGLTKLLGDKGPESLTYFILEQLPAAKIVIPIFLGTVFLSYVTAADSNTMAMAGISSTGMTQDSCEPKLPLKIIWGAVVGILALVMICTTGVDGIKMISNLGGLPALFFELAAGVALLIVAFNPARYCVHEKALLAKNQSAPDELVADAPLDRTLAEPALP